MFGRDIDWGGVAKEGAIIFIPGADLVDCAFKEGGCSWSDWGMGVIGVIPGGKLATAAVKITRAADKLADARRLAKVPISGRAQVTRKGGVETAHGSTSQRIAGEQAQRADAQSVHMNQTVGKITDGAVPSRVRPDVATVRTDGKIDAFEVLSPGQTVEQQTRKLQQALGDRAGDIRCVGCD